MTLKLPGSRETIDAVGSSILEQVQFGLPDDYYETFARKVRSLDLPAVTDAAKSTLRPDNLVWVVVGDRAKIEARDPPTRIGRGEVPRRQRQSDIGGQADLTPQAFKDICTSLQSARW